MPYQVMLYRCPGNKLLHGVKCETRVVDKLDEKVFDAALEDGWCYTPRAAFDKFNGKEVPPPLVSPSQPDPTPAAQGGDASIDKTETETETAESVIQRANKRRGRK